ncbi:helix-turn-helix domain-containing protein [Lactococcus taiwanensis]|uniref:helix-turn-helix domain-containing protein n=1 Tax=Lactococcus taiwanensis TaxID=1151742 RepID=UPI0035181743
MNNNDKIIEIIKNRRLALNLSLSEVARRMGIPKSTLSRYESLQRQFPLDQISTIASVLDLQPEDILGLNNQNKTETKESSILSEINHVSSKLDEPRQKIVLETASSQLKEQKDEEDKKNKVVRLKKKRLTDEELWEVIEHGVANDGSEQTEYEKQFFFNLLRENLDNDDEYED